MAKSPDSFTFHKNHTYRNRKGGQPMSNVAKIITDAILKKMEDAESLGTSFRWVKPWNSGLDRAYSYDTQIHY